MDTLVLALLIREAGSRLGRRVEEAGAREGRLLAIDLVPGGERLVIDLDPTGNLLYFDAIGGRALSRDPAEWQGLPGSRWVSIATEGTDRRLRLGFERKDRLGDRRRLDLRIRFFGTHSGLSLEEEGGRSLARLREPTADLPPPLHPHFASLEAGALASILAEVVTSAPEPGRAGALLSERVSGLGRPTAREVCHRARAAGAGSVEGLARDLLLLFREGEGPLRAPSVLVSPAPPTSGPSPALPEAREDPAGGGLRVRAAPLALAPTFAALDPGVEVRSFATMSEACRDAARLRGALPADRSSVGALRRLERLLESLRREAGRASGHEDLRRRGDLLLAHLSEIPPGAAQVIFPDFETGAPVGIDLDPALPPDANADRYFRRARRDRRGAELLEEKIRAAEERLARLRERLAEVPPLGQGGTAKRGARSGTASKTGAPGGSGRTSGHAHKAGGSARLPRRVPSALLPRELRTSEGLLILVGKSNRGNDHLTHAIARPEDYWFHADGQPGSHVVLRVEGRKEPGGISLREAAAIAAWYSKARPSSKVRVIYTRAKFVRKPRRGAAGLALVSKERSILVRPGLPAGARDDGEDFED